jgi:hypothetical protein
MQECGHHIFILAFRSAAIIYLYLFLHAGVRPECLSTFSPECWAIMEQCWASDPRDRILLGLVKERLTEMLKKCLDDMKEEDVSPIDAT